MPTLYWSDRWENPKGILPVLGELTHTQELCGEDTITFETMAYPLKGDRLLWTDDADLLHEHIIVRTSQDTSGICSVYAEGSQSELLGCYLENTKASGNGNAAITACLINSRFVADSSDITDTSSCWLYHTNALAAINKCADKWNAEFSFYVSRENGITKRHVQFLKQIGSDRGARFEHSLNMGDCVRTVLADEVYTALFGYGAGLAVLDEEGWTGGYHRKLTFGDINGGLNWVGDDDAKEVWGRWNTDHSAKEHVFGEVVFSDCEDATELLALTKEALEDAVVPKVSYELDAALVDGPEVQIGDTVAVVDHEISSVRDLKLRARKIVKVFKSEAVLVTLTLGEVEPTDYTSASDNAAKQDDTADKVGDIGNAVDKIVDELHPELKARCLYLDGGTLEFTYLSDEKSPSGGTVISIYEVVNTGINESPITPWDEHSKEITSVLIDSSFANHVTTSISCWFRNFFYLTSVSGMGNFVGVVDAHSCFLGCTALTTLDLCGFDASTCLNWNFTFDNCEALTTITADSDWTLSDSCVGDLCFGLCFAIVGGNGTTYSQDHQHLDYFRIDTEDTPGYLTLG